MSHTSRYIVGIDLGTTTCSLAYIDTLDLARGVQMLPLVQWEEKDSYCAADILPSFCYLPAKAEIKKGLFRLPLHTQGDDAYPVVGRFARAQASLTPGRVVHAAKSWLCHGGVDRDRAILPWHSDDVVGDERLSPVAASAAFLRHCRLVWDQAIAQHEASYRLAEQALTLTVPASFDEVASELTLQAAEQAGFERQRLRLLEEPQAAFYFWQMASSAPHRAQDTAAARFHISAQTLRGLLGMQSADSSAAPAAVRHTQTILICDIGGGTTDFSLLAVRLDASEQVVLERVAVSDHILLGGDNIDLAIAYELEKAFTASTGRKLNSRQWAELVFAARGLKEKALAAGQSTGEPSSSSSSSSDSAEEAYHVAIAGSGAGLFASSLSLTLARQEVGRIVLDGFFPSVGSAARPKAAELGLREWGLPYASDSAVTRHLAHFLAGQSVDAVLYTGGTLSPRFLQDRLTSQIATWQGRPPVVLENTAMELAVAQGAAVYGAACRYGEGRIAAGYPRSLYVEVASSDASKRALVCLLPKGYAGDQHIVIDQLQLKIRVGQPVAFQLYSASDRSDVPGTIVALEADKFHPLAPLETSLAATGSSKKDKGRLIAVNLEVTFSETGLLTLHCVAAEPALAEHKWLLAFNVQEQAAAKHSTSAASASDEPAMAGKTRVSAGALKQAEAKINEVYGKAKPKDGLPPNPNRLVRELEDSLQAERQKWDLPLLRSLWDALKQGETRRGRSESHESAWLNLSGFVLRPGYGDALDRFRVGDLWPLFNQGVAFTQSKQVQVQWWIFWRRIAGGLNKDQQDRIFAKIFPALRSRQASPEMIMLAGALERVDMNQKIRLGGLLVDELRERRPHYLEQKIWALTRIASRQPLYGGPQVIVRPHFVEGWLTALKDVAASLAANPLLCHFYSQAARRVNDREFDVDDTVRAEVIALMTSLGATPEQIDVVQHFVEVSQETYDRLFGESLPPGLILA